MDKDEEDLFLSEEELARLRKAMPRLDEELKKMEADGDDPSEYMTFGDMVEGGWFAAEDARNVLGPRPWWGD